MLHDIMIFVLGMVSGGSLVAVFHMGDKIAAVEEKVASKVVEQAKDLVNK